MECTVPLFICTAHRVQTRLHDVIKKGDAEDNEQSLYTPENQRLTLIECFSAWLRLIGAEPEL